MSLIIAVLDNSRVLKYAYLAQMSPRIDLGQALQLRLGPRVIGFIASVPDD